MRLNPCFCGSYNLMDIVREDFRNALGVLILVFVEVIISYLCPFSIWAMGETVLILVFVEVIISS